MCVSNSSGTGVCETTTTHTLTGTHIEVLLFLNDQGKSSRTMECVQVTGVPNDFYNNFTGHKLLSVSSQQMPFMFGEFLNPCNNYPHGLTMIMEQV